MHPHAETLHLPADVESAVATRDGGVCDGVCVTVPQGLALTTTPQLLHAPRPTPPGICRQGSPLMSCTICNAFQRPVYFATNTSPGPSKRQRILIVANSA